MPRNLTKLSLAFVVVVVASLSIGKCYSGERAAWEARVERVQEQARHDRAEAVKARAEADSLSEAADEALRAAESTEAEIQVRIDSVRVETPEGLREHPSILRRDSIIDAQSAVITQVRLAAGENCGSSVDLRADLARAVSAQCQAVKRLRQATADALERGDSLSAVLKDRPGERPWFLPSVSVGPFAGVCSGATPCAGPVAVTLGWKVSL